ncbi:MAG: helicase [Streptosporangiales bacterium]|nr:helicase [Streptosporangiales bacterium]
MSAPDQEQVHELDRPQRLASPGSYQVRDELAELVARDLLGPWDGPAERFAPKADGPRERYLVGALGPRDALAGAPEEAQASVDNGSGVFGDGADAELPEVTPASLGRLWASSMGLSCTVPTEITRLRVTAEWGRYAHEQVEDEQGVARTVWAREQVEQVREIALDVDPTTVVPLDDSAAGAGVRLVVNVRLRGSRRVVELALVNAQQEPESQRDTAWLFQTRLAVTATDGEAAVFAPVDDQADAGQAVTHNAEDAHLRLLYRHELRYANGRNVAVHPHVRHGERNAHRVETTWLPTYDVPATVAPSGDGTPLAGVELSMDALADADADTLRTGLLPLVDGYATWLDAREEELPTLPEVLRPAGVDAVAKARRAADRIRTGVELLTDPTAHRHDEALRAFRFANEAMAAQRRHTEIAQRRDREGMSYADAKSAVDAKGTALASWRPFQLAFVLLNLPSLTDPTHSERAADANATVDLLFFPTGGGKTEAYLGLTAYTFAIRRLQGTVGEGADVRSGEAGVAVLMRYTLRLLTAQQFQRAAALVCAAEVQRRRDEATWGTTPFRIGLWVGAGVSPNWFDQAKEQVFEAKEAGDGKRANVLQTLSCPWCGTALRGHHDLHVREPSRRVLLFCPNAEGVDACPFSQRRSDEGLPILTVDEEIYRYAPSLVIATVDKLAQLPWRGFAGTLFGRVRRRCSRHGYRHDDLDRKTKCGDRHGAKGNLPAATTTAVTRLRPPDLVIQDELHLISGALGTTVGLFEAAVDELCTWRPVEGREAGPKIIASTATTKRAAEQVLGVFARGLAIFPPQVLDIADTFFSRQVAPTPATPGRRYLGVCAHGVRFKSAEIQLAEALLSAGQTLYDKYGGDADPYQTVVAYFNAIRELAGMRRYLDDDVVNRLRRRGRRGRTGRVLNQAQLLESTELTSRISSGDISAALKRLEVLFDPELDTTARRSAIVADGREVRTANRGKSLRSKDRLDYHPRTQEFYDRGSGAPIDMVLATSMLQVGVDVSRFGLMVVTGQPKNTAEYIQASSRVGRDAAKPGLVVTLYNWTRPRDLAHYEDFAHYHATFYRQVEALSVTPYTRRSLDRGTAATFVAAVRQVDEAHSRNPDAAGVELDGPVVRRVIDRMLARARAVDGRRGEEYLDDRIGRLIDEWKRWKGIEGQLGYATDTGARAARGLLVRAGDGRWTDRTVAYSMRETEHEVNLLVAGSGGIYTPVFEVPAWSFAAPSNEPGDDDDEDDGNGGPDR